MKSLKNTKPSSLFVTVATAAHKHTKTQHHHYCRGSSFFTHLPRPHSRCLVKPSRTITESSQNLPHFRPYHSPTQASTSQIPPHHRRKHTAIIMVFIAMTTNAPTTIPLSTITKFPLNRRQRNHTTAHSPRTNNCTDYYTKAHYQIHQ